MKNLELLPKGKFILRFTDENGKVKEYPGRFSIFAIDQYYIEMGLKSHKDLVERVSVGMSIKEYAVLIKEALNDYNRDAKKYTTENVMYLLDDVFENGIADEEFKSLIFHGLNRVFGIQIGANEVITLNKEEHDV